MKHFLIGQTVWCVHRYVDITPPHLPNMVYFQVETGRVISSDPVGMTYYHMDFTNSGQFVATVNVYADRDAAVAECERLNREEVQAEERRKKDPDDDPAPDAVVG